MHLDARGSTPYAGSRPLPSSRAHQTDASLMSGVDIDDTEKGRSAQAKLASYLTSSLDDSYESTQRY